MQTWAKYAISFFALILILTGFIYWFGPASTRQAFRSGETQTGQLRADAQLETPGEPTISGTSQPVAPPAGAAPAGQIQAQPQGPQPLTNTPGSPLSPGDKSGNPAAVNAK